MQKNTIIRTGLAIISSLFLLSTTIYGIPTPLTLTLDATIDQIDKLKLILPPLITKATEQTYHDRMPTSQTLETLNATVATFDTSFYHLVLEQYSKKIYSHETVLTEIINDFLTSYHLPATKLNQAVLILLFLQEITKTIKNKNPATKSQKTCEKIAQATAKTINQNFIEISTIFFSEIKKKQETLTTKKNSYKKWLLLALLLIGCWTSYKIYKYLHKSNNAPAEQPKASWAHQKERAKEITQLEQELKKMHESTKNAIENLETKIKRMGTYQVESINALCKLSPQEPAHHPEPVLKRAPKSKPEQTPHDQLIDITHEISDLINNTSSKSRDTTNHTAPQALRHEHLQKG